MARTITEKKNSKCKGLMAAFLVMLFAMSIMVINKPTMYMTAADVVEGDSDTKNMDFSEGALYTLTNGVLVAAVSDGRLLTAYDTDTEQMPEVSMDMAMSAIGVWLADGRLTEKAAAVQTVAQWVNDEGDGTYTVTLPAGTLLINGIVDVDKLAVYAVMKSQVGSGAEISPISFTVSENSADVSNPNVTLSIPNVVTLLLIDDAGDGELHRNNGENEPVSRSELPKESTDDKTAVPTKSTEDKSEEKPHEHSTAEVETTLEAVSAAPRREKHTLEDKKLAAQVSEPTSGTNDRILEEIPPATEEMDKAPVTGGRDF